LGTGVEILLPTLLCGQATNQSMTVQLSHAFSMGPQGKAKELQSTVVGKKQPAMSNCHQASTSRK